MWSSSSSLANSAIAVAMSAWVYASAADAGIGAATCRNLATELTAQVTGTGFTASLKTNCRFDPSNRQMTCAVQFADDRGTSMTSTSTATYNSVADVIDEIAVIPPLNYAQKTIASQTGNRGGASTTVTNTFDANRRITKTVSMSPAGDSTTTYSAWDAAGRPTRAADVGKGFSNVRDITYDDAARTKTTVVNGGPLRTVETFDNDGNQIETLSTSGAAAIGSKTAIKVISSQRLCK